MQPIQAIMPPIIGRRKNKINPAKNITIPPVILAYSKPKGPKNIASTTAVPTLLLFPKIITLV